MGTAAQFDGIILVFVQVVAHRKHAHLVAIFFAEQGFGAGGDGLVGGHQAGGGVAVLADDGVDLGFDLFQFFGADRLGMREVKAQAFGRDQRTLLADMAAQHALQRGMQQMGGGMVGAGGAATFGIHRQVHRIARRKRAFCDAHGMHMQRAQLLLGVGDLALGLGGFDGALVAGLAAGFAIEGRLVGENFHRLAGAGLHHAAAILEDGQHLAFGGFGVIAQEFGAADFVQHGEPLRLALAFAGAGPAGAGLGLLLLHRGGETVGIHRDAAGAQGFFGQVQREAIGVVELEGDIALELVALHKTGAGFIQQLEAARERFAEADFFQLQGFGDQGFAALELAIGRAHFGHQRRHQAVHQRVPGAQQMRMAHGAAHDAAQDIAAAFIGRQHAVRNQEGGGPQVIGDDAVAESGLAGGLHAAGGFRRRDQVTEQVHIVIVGDALQNGGDALQPHAGVNRRLGQVEAGLFVHLLELHEDEIPEFQITVAVFVGRTWRAAGHGWALVKEDFRAIAAGAGRAHGPQIVGVADDAVIAEAGDLLPQSAGLFVGRVDRDQQLVLGQADHLGDEIPGEGDGLFLEVIAEGEIPQHLEESVVAGGIADIVQIVVLAAGADAFLDGGGAGIGPLFGTGEQVLELHHARIGEQQGGIVARDQGRGWHRLVAPLGEEFHKSGADVRQAGQGLCHGNRL